MPQFAKLMLIVALLICSAAVCTKTSSDGKDSIAADFVIDQDKARADLTFFTAQVHPFGSAYQAKVGDYLLNRAKEEGASATTAQSFSAQTPNPAALEDSSGPIPLTKEKTGRNIIASITYSGNDCWYVLGSHYDTKDIPGINYLGANDGGSSSILLLQLIRLFKPTSANPGCDLLFVWFDGEEAVLTDWTTGENVHPAKIQDNTYGSRHFVEQLSDCGEDRCYNDKPLNALVLLDMIGMPDLTISMDSNSTPDLLAMMKQAAQDLGLSKHIASQRKSIEDDHIPFLEMGIPSLNMINFEDLSVWHRSGDEVGAVSLESIEIAGKIGALVVLRLHNLPKGI